MATNAIRLGNAITGVLVAMGADPTLAAPIGLQLASVVLTELTTNATVIADSMVSPSGAVTGTGKIT